MKYLLLVALVAGAVAGCSLFGGGGGDALAELRGLVRSEVADEERAARMLAEIDRLESVIDDYNATSAAAGEELRALNRDYDATRAQFEAMLQRQNEVRSAARDLVVASALELRDLATAEEWKEMAELEIRVYRERLQLLGAGTAEGGR